MAACHRKPRCSIRVDAHHHLWRYDQREYGWIGESMLSLRRDYLAPELATLMEAAGVQMSIAVQARQTLEETKSLLDAAASHPFIRGVVGWAPFRSSNFPALLEDLCHNRLLRGLRHVVQDEAPGFLDDEHFNRGIRDMRGSGLVYDLLIYARQLPEAIRFVDRHPEQVFVVDHIAKPDIRNNGSVSWTPDIRDLARRDNVVCKLSGMVTEADWEAWTPAQLTFYFDTVLEAFGPDRLMVGSDWPVLTVACPYVYWWRLVDTWLAPLSTSERTLIEGEVATRVYGLETPVSGLVDRA